MGDLDGSSEDGSDGELPASPGRGRPIVRTIESTAGRTVFSETGNTDAWIATDYTTAVQR